MYTDARAFDVAEVPDEVVQREHQMQVLTSKLAPIIRGRPAPTPLLTGPSGAGKTCIARSALNRLRKQIPNLNHHYIDCWSHETRYRVLREVIEGIDALGSISSTITSAGTLLERLQDYDGPPIVLVLDEVDQISDNMPLHDLAKIREVSLVLIANREEDVRAAANDRLSSRLHISETIRFDRYTIDELVAILEKRVEWGLEPDVIDREKLEYIADAAAGNARGAIITLRVAVDEAIEAGVERVTHDMIETAIPIADEELQKKSLSRLTNHQRALYEVLNEADEDVSAGPINERYCEHVREPVGPRMVRIHLNKLIAYNLVVGEGAKRGRTYRVAD